MTLYNIKILLSSQIPGCLLEILAEILQKPKNPIKENDWKYLWEVGQFAILIYHRFWEKMVENQDVLISPEQVA